MGKGEAIKRNKVQNHQNRGVEFQLSLIESFRHIPINMPFASLTPAFDNIPEDEKSPRRQETPLCRIFGCKKEDVFLGISVSHISDQHGIFYADEDYETSCLRCFKIFGYKSIAAVRREGYKLNRLKEKLR